MLKWLGRLVDSNEKQIKRLSPLVDIINSLEQLHSKLTSSDTEVYSHQEFRELMTENLAHPIRSRPLQPLEQNGL